MTTRIYLIRHAHYSQIGHTLAGRSDHALDDAGRDQARRLGERLAATRLAAVLSSPVRRALQTAEAIATTRGFAVQAEPLLNEIDFGAWRGRSFAELEGDPAWTAWNARRSLGQAPGGETMLAVQTRAVAVVQSLAACYPDAELAAVSHGDVIRGVLLHLLGMPLDLLHRLRIDPASCSTVELHGSATEVLCINEGTVD